MSFFRHCNCVWKSNEFRGLSKASANGGKLRFQTWYYLLLRWIRYSQIHNLVKLIDQKYGMFWSHKFCLINNPMTLLYAFLHECERLLAFSIDLYKTYWKLKQKLVCLPGPPYSAMVAHAVRLIDSNHLQNLRSLHSLHNI